mmetsp:Transcript_26522/g.67944  ORF Transcript_26522/g.67944 Transcript_26522/m.67944 type:complete len:114 (-) Transcript_26522:3688-4029(-)
MKSETSNCHCFHPAILLHFFSNFLLSFLLLFVVEVSIVFEFRCGPPALFLISFFSVPQFLLVFLNSSIRLKEKKKRKRYPSGYPLSNDGTITNHTHNKRSKREVETSEGRSNV